MIRLYSMPSSGNSYKTRLLLAKLGIPFQHVTANYATPGADPGSDKEQMTLTPAFRQKNPAGKVPLVEFLTTDDGVSTGEYLSESNAILHYFAEGTRFLPSGSDHKTKLERARVYQWMFFEQNVHEGSVAVRMAVFNYPNREMDRSPARMEALLQSGNHALDVMEQQLNQTPFLAGQTLSMADICLYGYTHRAALGGFDVTTTSRKGIAAWLERVEKDPGHVTIDWLPADASI